MSKQVQLRGGTTAEHENFIGAPREVTVDTDLNTIRVHDGQTPGGHELSTVSDMVRFEKKVNQKFDEFEMDFGASHNHDNRYSKIGHKHDDIYAKKLANGKNLSTLSKNNYEGFAFDDGTDTNYIRTTKNGIIPYQSGGYSNIGTSTWQFANGYFVTLNANEVKANTIHVSKNSIKFANNDYINFNDTENTFDFMADDSLSKSLVRCGCIEIAGRRIYVGSSFPSDARTNDILIQI